MSDVAELPWIRETIGPKRLCRLLDHAVELGNFAASNLYSLADFLAAVPADSAEEAGILIVPLMLALDEGSLAIELNVDALLRRLGDFGPAEELQPWIAAALGKVEAGRFSALVTIATGDAVPRTPIVLWRNRGGSYLYFQKYFLAERDLYRLLRGRLVAPVTPKPIDRLRDAVNDVLMRSPLSVDGKPIASDFDQRTALGLALLRDFVIISGGPGTGKTSIVLNVLRALVRAGLDPERIALAAPTGRAAQRLGDSLRAGLASLGSLDERRGLSPPEMCNRSGLPEGTNPSARQESVDSLLLACAPVTLHQLLQYDPKRNTFRRHEENLIPADVVLVDEASMISVDLMASLLRALAPGAKLLLLGDKDQLPSVDAGAVLGQLVQGLDAAPLTRATCESLRDLVPGMKELVAGGDHWLADAVVFLRTNHRSHPEIRAAAAAVNRQQVGPLEKLPTMPANATAADWQQLGEAGGCLTWPQRHATPAELKAMLSRWMENAYRTPDSAGASLLELLGQDSPDLGRLFRALERTRILTMVRDGPWGCDQINEYLAEWLRRRLGRGRSDRQLFPGVPVLVTRNDLSLGLMNGEVGLTIGGRGGLRVAFARNGRFDEIQPESLPSHERGFAMTVHKSQGSEYEQVLLVLPPTGGRRLLTKELLYTAITRAKKLVILSATPAALRDAVSRRIERDSGE
jgi:exodeoxyribonuclease V alpha subunit